MPRVAPRTPPDMGASMKRPREGGIEAAMARDSAGAMVEQSMNNRDGFSEESAMMNWIVDATWAAAGRAVMTTSCG